MNVRKLAAAALCLALCFGLPFLTGQIPEIGNMISPMHIPVFLCGFICGWQYGLAVGFMAPILRSALFTMPPMMPEAVSMAFELAAYGCITGVLFSMLKRSKVNIYVSLIIAMFLGRLVWGAAAFVFYGMQGMPFTFGIFLAKGFVQAVPAIIIHIVIIPVLIMALEKANIIESK